MTTLTAENETKLLALLEATRENLDRIEALLKPAAKDDLDDLDVSNPLNKSGQFLTHRGIEVCYRMFDAGKTRYAVAEGLGLSYGAANHRFYTWDKLGGKNRVRKPLE